MRIDLRQLRNLDFELDPLKQSRLAWFALTVLLVIGVGALAESIRNVVQLSVLLRSEQQVTTSKSPTVATFNHDSNAAPASSVDDSKDFVAELPSIAPSDLQIRFVAKIAHEQRVTVMQMQTQAMKVNPKGLGETQVTLQLRGDYRDIKNVWIALLEKYPGLTLERLTLRHHPNELPVPALPPATSALPPADRAEDEASIEMTQYTQPDQEMH